MEAIDVNSHLLKNNPCICIGYVQLISAKQNFMEKRWLTLPEAATELDLSADTIRRWAKKGLIKGGRNNLNHRIFNEEELIRAKSKYLGHNERPHELIIHKSKTTSFSAIELFSGCGGMALGLKNAGFQTKLLVEINKQACATLRKNNTKWKVVEGDLFKLNEESYFDQFRGQVDLVAGGFPCQSFSYAGKGLGFGDPRGSLFFEMLKCINSVQPKIVIGENVRGLLKHDQGKTLATIVSYLEDSGYDTVYHVLRAQFYDVPQKRERLVIMGIRKDLGLTHIFPREKDYILNLREALKNVPPSIGQSYPEKKRSVMELVPPGGYWRDLPVEIQKDYMQTSFFHTGGRTGMARRLAWDEPSLTLTCAPAQKQTERCHPEETRPLTVREYARIQTFPDNWEFSGSASDQYKQIGNAVPVNLAYYIGSAVIRTLENKGQDKDFFIKTKDFNKKITDQMELNLG